MGDKPETGGRKKRISIKRVAEEAGVSVAAVSLALSGKGRVSQKRAEEIKKIADRLGFIPNHNASRLRSGESILLGLMVNDISNPFYAELTKDVEEQAYAHDYLSLIANTNDDLERQSALIRAMIGQGVAGLIIVPAAGSTPDTFSLLRDWGMPYVMAVRDIGDQSADFVGFDDPEAGRIAGEHLLDLGHESFVMLGGAIETHNWKQRLAGLRKALAARGVELPDSHVRPFYPTRRGATQHMNALLDEGLHFTALVCFNDYVAMGAYEALRDRREIGREISVIGFDNVPESAGLNPPLTTVELYPRRIGRQAALALLHRLKSEEGARERVYLMPELVERRSTGAARAE